MPIIYHIRNLIKSKNGVVPISAQHRMHKKKKSTSPKWDLSICGAPGGIRTRDLLVRSQTLYPAELPAHMQFLLLKYINTIKAKSQHFFTLDINKSFFYCIPKRPNYRHTNKILRLNDYYISVCRNSRKMQF